MTIRPSDYVYVDHAATSPLRAEALDAMLPYLREQFGNPSSIHRLGRDALGALENARQQVATVLRAEKDEIIFTSGGTESDNLALRGLAMAGRGRGHHIVTSAVEHEAILRTCEQLHEHLGIETAFLPVDTQGRVNPVDVERAITDRTILVSVMYANNEVGTLQPIREMAHITHVHGIPFHTDAVQAAGALSLDVRELNCDLLSLSAHKFGGPRGVGILYVRRGISLAPQLTGGGQESDRRSGTEYVAGAVGAAVALQLAQEGHAENAKRLESLRDRLIESVLAQIDGAYLTGHRLERLPGHASFVIAGVESEILLLALDREGIGASAGSACTVGKHVPSHVLAAMGVAPNLMAGAVRFTFGAENTVDDVARISQELPRAVARVRTMLAYQPTVDQVNAVR